MIEHIKRRPKAKSARRSGPCRCGLIRESLHRDHVIPLWQGGADDESNIQYLCANCHEDKTFGEHKSAEFKAWVRSRVTPERREKARRIHTGKVVSAETREKLRVNAGKPGVPRPDTSARLKAYWADPEWRARTIASYLKRPPQKTNPVITNKILDAMRGASVPISPKEIAVLSGVKRTTVCALLTFVRLDGRVLRVARGRYVLAPQQAPVAPALPAVDYGNLLLVRTPSNQQEQLSLALS